MSVDSPVRTSTDSNKRAVLKSHATDGTAVTEGNGLGLGDLAFTNASSTLIDLAVSDSAPSCSAHSKLETALMNHYGEKTGSGIRKEEETISSILDGETLTVEVAKKHGNLVPNADCIEA